MELLVELDLPLLDETAGRDDEAALEGAPDEELTDEQAGHDRLAGTRVVSQQEAKRLARQHLLVDRGDLVWQRLDRGGGHREERVEQVGEVDALCLGDQAEQGAIAIEAPRTSLFGDLEAALGLAVEDLGANRAIGQLVGELDRVRAIPLGPNDRGEAGGRKALDDRPGCERLKLCDRDSSPASKAHHTRFAFYERQVVSRRRDEVLWPQSTNEPCHLACRSVRLRGDLRAGWGHGASLRMIGRSTSFHRTIVSMAQCCSSSSSSSGGSSRISR